VLNKKLLPSRDSGAIQEFDSVIDAFQYQTPSLHRALKTPGPISWTAKPGETEYLMFPFGKKDEESGVSSHFLQLNYGRQLHKRASENQLVRVLTAQVSEGFNGTQHMDLVIKFVKGSIKSSKIGSLNQEGQVLGKLRHENVIRLFASFHYLDPHENACGFLLLEHAQNDVSKYTFTPESFRHFQVDICKGLAYIHSKRIVHRDIKKHNILVVAGDPHDIFKIGDGDLMAELNANGKVDGEVGTQGYMAPECSGEAATTTPASDMFSLGVTTYKLHQKAGPEAPDYALKYPLTDSELTPDLHSQHMFRITLKTLKSLPEERPSATELLSEYRNAIQ